MAALCDIDVNDAFGTAHRAPRTAPKARPTALLSSPHRFDVVTAKTLSADAVATVKKPTEVVDDELILDIAPHGCTLGRAQLRFLV